jgi:hypothetical protein
LREKGTMQMTYRFREMFENKLQWVAMQVQESLHWSMTLRFTRLYTMSFLAIERARGRAF